LEDAYLDTKDPNYDSEEEADNVVMVCVESAENQTKSNLPELEENQFESEIKLVILEYFQNGDAIEVSFLKFKRYEFILKFLRI